MPLVSAGGSCRHAGSGSWATVEPRCPARAEFQHSRVPIASSAMPAEKPTPRTQDARRSNKPIMEKRRRARINTCLNELKSLILEALRKDPSRHSKLEKADILEMTVKHLQSVQRHQMALAMASDPSVLSKFRSGFNECANEVSRYVGRIDGVDQGVRRRLVNHLGNCVTGLNVMNPLTVAAGVGNGGGNGGGGSLLTPTTWGLPQVVPQIPFSVGELNVSNSGSAARLLGGLSLIPGRLLTGDIALLLPGSHPSLLPLFSPAGGASQPAPATPSATVTCDSDASSLQSTEKPSAFTAVPRGPVGALSPVSTAGSCTSGSSAFSPTLRDSTPPPPSKEPSSTNDEQQKTTTEEEEDEDSEGRAGSSTSHPESTQPSSSSADTDRMWRPW